MPRGIALDVHNKNMLVSDKRLNAVPPSTSRRSFRSHAGVCSRRDYHGAFKTEIREYPFPEMSPESGILKVEAAGLAVRSVGGQGAPGAVHVAVLPWL
jgi:hypothetical protein